MSNTIGEWRAAVGRRILYKKNTGFSSLQEAVVAEFTAKNNLKLDHKPQGGGATWVREHELSYLDIIEVLDDPAPSRCGSCTVRRLWCDRCNVNGGDSELFMSIIEGIPEPCRACRFDSDCKFKFMCKINNYRGFTEREIKNG